jgi:hypothetical protein
MKSDHGPGNVKMHPATNRFARFFFSCLSCIGFTVGAEAPAGAADLPDLAPVSVSAAVAVSGQSVQIVTVATNQGNGTAYPASYGYWFEQLWISTNAVWDDTATRLAAWTQSEAVPAGGGYGMTNTVSLPNWATGTCHLIYQVDSYSGYPPTTTRSSSRWRPTTPWWCRWP